MSANVFNVARRLAAAAPEVLIVDSMPKCKIVHAVLDEDAEPRREVFVMSGYTWSCVEKEASLISPYVGNRWRVCRAKDVGLLSHDDALLILPLPKTVGTFTLTQISQFEALATVPRREWLIQLR